MINFQRKLCDFKSFKVDDRNGIAKSTHTHTHAHTQTHKPLLDYLRSSVVGLSCVVIVPEGDEGQGVDNLIPARPRQNPGVKVRC